MKLNICCQFFCFQCKSAELCAYLQQYTDAGFHMKRNDQCELCVLKYFPIFLNTLIAQRFSIRFTMYLSLVLYYCRSNESVVYNSWQKRVLFGCGGGGGVCLTMQPWLTWTPPCRAGSPSRKRSACLCLSNAGNKGMCCYPWLILTQIDNFRTSFKRLS